MSGTVPRCASLAPATVMAREVFLLGAPGSELHAPGISLGVRGFEPGARGILLGAPGSGARNARHFARRARLGARNARCFARRARFGRMKRETFCSARRARRLEREAFCPAGQVRATGTRGILLDAPGSGVWSARRSARRVRLGAWNASQVAWRASLGNSRAILGARHGNGHRTASIRQQRDMDRSTHGTVRARPVARH